MSDATGKHESGRHVFRYDDHMPTTDDPALIVLKGHLLIEEMLVEATEAALPNPQHLLGFRLSFPLRVALVRSLSPQQHGHTAWALMLTFNKLRNDLAHNLEPPKLRRLMEEAFAIDKQTQPFFRGDGIRIDKSQRETMDPCEQLKAAVVTCMQFLISVLSVIRDEKS